MVFKFPHLLSLLILFLSLCLTSLALRRDPVTEVLRCLDDCNDEDVQEFIACHKECELQYREREERREEEERPGSRELDPRWRRRRGHGGGGGGKWEPEGPRGEREHARDPRGEYDQCRRLCEPYKPRERERCWQQCEERETARERRRDREREREVNDRVRNPPGDPSLSERYERCKRTCERQAGGQQRQLCKFRCRQHREREERERPEGGDVNLSLATTTDDPQKQFQHCRQRCEQQQGREMQRRQCQQECERQFRKQQRGKRRSTNPREQEEEEEELGESGDNPYYFHSRTLHSRFDAEEGHIRLLERFDKRSELLKGLKNYRLETFEAKPNTFVLPHHVDADYILVVLKGEGTISLVWQETKESHHLERGDVIRVPAGTTVYFASTGYNEQVCIAKLIQPINTPGTFKEFYPVGTENPESYYTVFSNKILESSLKTSRDQIERLFGQQRQGVIIRASKEQLQALSERHGSSKKKSHSSKGPFNLLGQKPTYSNEFGQFFQASPEDFKQLQDLGVSVTFAEVSQGSIMVPHYNSKSTTVVLVVEGNGWFEMACPHLALARQRWGSGGVREQEEEEEEEEEQETAQGGGARYQKITSRLSPGDVFIIPAGHPIAIVAEQNENLRMVGFGINARNNQRIFLAGKENIINQMDREAKELSFDLPAEEVERVFRSQEESYFVSSQRQTQSKPSERGKTEGPRHLRRKRMDRGDSEGSEGSSLSPMASILDVAGLF